MGRPRLEEGQVATTQRLLSAAELEFGERGYHGAKLQDIAARAGISRPSLLYHYHSKDALYDAVVRAVFAELGATLEAAMARADDFEGRLDAIVAGFVEFVRGRRATARLVLRQIMDEHGPGQDLLIEVGVPLIRLVEEFIRTEGGARIPDGLPIRGALLQVVGSTFVKAASGPLEAALWGDEDPHRTLTRLLFASRRHE